MDRAPYAYPLSQYYDAAQDGDFSMTVEFLCLNRIKRGENEDKTVCCAPAPPCPHVPCQLLRGAAITAVLGLRGSFSGGIQAPFPPAVAHRLLLSSLTAAIE